MSSPRMRIRYTFRDRVGREKLLARLEVKIFANVAIGFVSGYSRTLITILENYAKTFKLAEN